MEFEAQGAGDRVRFENGCLSLKHCVMQSGMQCTTQIPTLVHARGSQLQAGALLRGLLQLSPQFLSPKGKAAGTHLYFVVCRVCK